MQSWNTHYHNSFLRSYSCTFKQNYVSNKMLKLLFEQLFPFCYYFSFSFLFLVLVIFVYLLAFFDWFSHLKNVFGNLFLFSLLAILSEKIAYCKSKDHVNDDDLQECHEVYDTAVLEASLSLGIKITDLHCDDAHQEEEDISTAGVVAANILFKWAETDEWHDYIYCVHEDCAP